MFLNFQFSKFKKFVLLPLKTQRSGNKAVCCFSIILILKVMMKVKESKSQKDILLNKNFIKKELPATLLKKRLWHRCFPVNFTKFLRTPFHRTRLGDCFLKYKL